MAWFDDVFLPSLEERVMKSDKGYHVQVAPNGCGHFFITNKSGFVERG